MTESTRLASTMDEAEAEVELSAQELRALSGPRRHDEGETRPTLQSSISASHNLEAPRARTKRYVSASRLSLSLTAAVAIVGTAYVLTGSPDVNRATATTAQQTAQSQWPKPEQFAEGDPVRFANPFDTNEVFEFPPGTTESEARDAVAELLMERAISRQKT